jgi:hypothetical protein
MLIINKTKQVEYKELKPGDVIVCGELFNNNPWFDCIVLVVNYENKWFKALTINQGIKKYAFFGTLHIIDKDDV